MRKNSIAGALLYPSSHALSSAAYVRSPARRIAVYQLCLRDPVSLLAYLIEAQLVRTALPVNAIHTQSGGRRRRRLALRIRALGRTVRTAVRRTVGIVFISMALAYPVAAVAAAANRILPGSDLPAVQIPGRLFAVHAQRLVYLSAVVVFCAFAGFAAFDIQRGGLAVGRAIRRILAQIAHSIVVAG